MKTPRLIFWLILISIIVISIFVFREKKNQPQIPYAESSPTQAASNVPNGATGTLVQVTQSNTISADSNLSAMPAQDKGTQIKQGLSEMNDISIVFYGRLEDQFGNPIPYAEIACSVRIYNGTQSTVDRFSATSDGNGFFTINHGKGESLSVVPSKKGYVSMMTKTSYNYSFMYSDHITSDQSNPTIIKMWKLQGAEPLVDISKEYRLPFTDKPISFDLIEKNIVPTGGDIKITVHRPSGEVSEHNVQKWSINFEVIGGGFIETSGKDSAVTFAAPLGDYQSSGVFENNNGPDLIDKALFLKSRDGRIFSKLHLWFRINNKPEDLMHVEFGGVANTNSSGNWEATVPE
ncbi:MAG TPA: carboxypeptidase-like regulatory domain-containing protein [Verrucomicrobiae bacterium]|nr:carboxypeptidase-like regulatory domain-containing protein [Verrucomicrobiae bacterium]